MLTSHVALAQVTFVALSLSTKPVVPHEGSVSHVAMALTVEVGVGRVSG